MARIPRSESVEVELPRADQVKRASHQGCFVNKMRGERIFELFSFETADSRPQPNVRRRRVLGLHAGDSLDCRYRIEVSALEEQLPCERPAIELATRGGLQASGCAPARLRGSYGSSSSRNR